MEFSDDEILARAKDNLSYFSPIYLRYAKPIHDYCLSRLHNKADAEDITSQVFINAMTNLDRFHSGSIKPWLFTIARNLIIDHVRKYQRQVDFDLHKIYEWDTTPIERVIKTENETLIRELISQLPTPKQDLILLRFIGGLSAQEISQITEKSETAVRVEIHRIIKMLRQKVLETEGVSFDESL